MYNKHIQFELHNSPLMSRIVQLKERDYADRDSYPDAPQDYPDAMDSYDRLLDVVRDIMDTVVAPNAESVDAGFCDHDLQIGQTGVTVRPKVYIACGISGAIQHVAGMKESGIVISVNSDPDAPINQIADYVIHGTVQDVLPKMIKYYKQHSK